MGENNFLLFFFHFPHPSFFPKQSFAFFTTTIVSFRENSMVVGMGEKLGGGENEKG